MRRATADQWVQAAVSVLTVALTAGALSSCAGADTAGAGGTSRRSDGPVAFPGSEIEQSAGWTGGAGVSAVYGATVVVNHGKSPATIDAARLVGDVPSAVAEIADTRIVDLGPAPGSGDLVGVTAWPLDKPFLKKWWKRSQPAEGATLGPHQAAEVVFVVDVHQDGHWSWPQTALDYDVKGTKYTTSTNFGFSTS